MIIVSLSRVFLRPRSFGLLNKKTGINIQYMQPTTYWILALLEDSRPFISYVATDADVLHFI